VSVETPEDIQPLEQLTPPAPATRRVPVKKAPPRKKAAPKQGKTEAEIRAEIEAEFRRDAELRAQIEAEVRAQIAAEQASNPTLTTSLNDLTELEETPYVHVTPGPGEIVIHFLDDGATVGPRLYRRGEELAVNPEEHPWVNMSRAKQQKLHGRQLWAKGPWPYGGFDLTDPELTVDDKIKLLAAASS